MDIGTSSVRAALYDDAGNVLPKTMVKNERSLTATDDGGAEIDADEAFDQVVRAIDEVLKRSENVKGGVDARCGKLFLAQPGRRRCERKTDDEGLRLGRYSEPGAGCYASEKI